MTPFTFNTTPSLRMGAGLARQLADIVRPVCGEDILFVTDPGMVATGLVGQVVENLRAAGLR